MVIADYRAWRAVGPGGLPANPLGWGIARALGTVRRDTLSTSGDTDHRGPDALALPRRGGSRPAMAPFVIPHRQLDGIPDTSLVSDLLARVAAVGEQPGCHVATSRLERHGDAVFADDPGASWVRATGGEVAHVHAGQGSLHVVAAPADVATIIDHGWGERHPLAGRRPLGLPDSYLFLYAPVDESQTDTVLTIVRRCVAQAGPAAAPL
ncbi:luciferase domain-containing protein [Williamsia deligens]|uniref:Luciferase family protein n=1 Tax=Williamsia deligens TaxID=321325 RepID=A0ABW3GD68_9NOCA|nr:luciferase family protein [Williamsia deligens]MCP2195159.1 hypothetical protein [Williamsia deligens]